jgi:hypothetical protein
MLKLSQNKTLNIGPIHCGIVLVIKHFLTCLEEETKIDFLKQNLPGESNQKN